MNINDLRPVQNSGIYAIYINNKAYIGSATNLKERKKRHKKNLNTKKHPNKHLQSAFSLYREFDFKILELCEPSQLLEKEERWIKWFDSCDPSKGYNKRQKPNSNLGLKFSEETRQKQRLAHLGHKRNLGRHHKEETKRKLSEQRKGKPKPHFRDLKRWPHADGFNCKCNECRIKRNEKERLRLENIRRANNIPICRKLDKWPHENGSRCKCNECKAKRSAVSLAGYHRRKNSFILNLNNELQYECK